MRTCFTTALFTTYMNLLISFCAHGIWLYSYSLRTKTFPLAGKKETLKSASWWSQQVSGCSESHKAPKPFCVFVWVVPVSGRRKLISGWLVGGEFQGHSSQEPIPEWALSDVMQFLSDVMQLLLKVIPINLFCDAYQVITSTLKVCTLILHISYILTVNVYQIIISILNVCVLILHVSYILTMWKLATNKN